MWAVKTTPAGLGAEGFPVEVFRKLAAPLAALWDPFFSLIFLLSF
jgi:hypothetical protein